MAIVRLEERNPYFYDLGFNYGCDICGLTFNSKHNANEHHRTEHGSDKQVLDTLVGKWFKKNGVYEAYAYISSIDYQNNEVNIIYAYCYNFRDSPNMLIATSIEPWSIYRVKKEFFRHTIWEETSFEEVLRGMNAVINVLLSKIVKGAE